MRAKVTTQMKESEILLNCYREFERQCESNNFQFNINLQQTFQGPIELTTIKNKGRCWIATEPIKSGQLLLIEKAFVYSSRIQHSFTDLYNDLYLKNKSKQHVQDLIFDETAILMTQLIKNKIVKNLQENTDDVTAINKLKYLYPRSNQMEFMEIFEPKQYGIESESDLWLFNYSLLQLLKYKNKDIPEINDILLKRIPYIVYCNAMMITQNTEQLCYFKPIYHLKDDDKHQQNDDNIDDEKKQDLTTNDMNDKEFYSSSYSEMIGDGIFLKGSFFNHDCSPNVNRYFIGDILIVKALHDIQVGEECTFSYLETEYLCESESFRANRLPFDCNCNKCITQRSGKKSVVENENEIKNYNDQKQEEEEEEEEESDDDIQIFDEIRCQSLISNEPGKRIKMIDDLMKTTNIRFIDIISGYSAKAMGFLELKQYEQAGGCWMECVYSIKKSFGDIHENMVPFYLQTILCQINKLIIDSNDTENNDDNIIEIVTQNDEIMGLIKEMIKIHDICFGGGYTFFLRRYGTELSFSGYPSQSKSFLLWNSIVMTQHSLHNKQNLNKIIH